MSTFFIKPSQNRYQLKASLKNDLWVSWGMCPLGRVFSLIISYSKSLKWQPKTQDKPFINSFWIKNIVNLVENFVNIWTRINYKQYFYNLFGIFE